MCAPVIKLFSDRISHPSRAALILLRSAQIPHQEVNVRLFRGEHRKRPELPFQKVPVLIDDKVSISEPCTILRYLGHLPQAQRWYAGKPLQERTKIDEFLDFWQSTIHPNVVTLTQNKLMFKMLLKHFSPDQEVVEQCWKIHKDHKDIIQRYFIGENQFIGGDDVSVADLMLVVTLQQTALTGCHHDEFHQYIARVRQRTNTSFFDELDFQTKRIAAGLRRLVAIPNGGSGQNVGLISF